MANDAQPRVDWNRVPFKLKGRLMLMCRSLSYNQAMALSHGATDTDLRWFRLRWVWSAYRLSDVDNASERQHRCLLAIGGEGLERRFMRVQALYGRYLQREFGQYLA